MAEDQNPELIALTADVVAAYVSNNKIHSEELARLIGSTFEALKSAGAPTPSEPERQMPDKAAIRKSQHPDHLTSFIGGKKYKSLKRHLNGHGLTPQEYRERNGLPKDYPMVAPSYSAQRSELAKARGLGRRAQAAAPAAASKPAAAKGRGRGMSIKPQDETFT